MGSLGAKSRRVDQIEASHLRSALLWVVVFGPGHGEAIVVKLPDGRVGIVDGCREPPSDCPVTQLLDGLGTSRLLFACLTHPHEDHYRGLARLIQRYQSSIDHLWHVFALTQHERTAVVRYAKEFLSARRGSGLPDMKDWKPIERVFGAIMNATQAKRNPASRRQLLVDRLLLREPVAGHDLQIEAWGPTDSDSATSMMAFAMAKPGKNSRWEHLPNAVSGAILVEWGSARVLLAGDLYKHSHSHRGWGPARAKVAGRPVQVVNVAHHASLNAHDALLWQAMNPSLAIVTPFRNAIRAMPPRPSDIRRLSSPSCEVVITSSPEWSRVARPGDPRPQSAGGAPAPLVSPPLGASPRLGATATPGAKDAGHGVAVGLDASGAILEVILAGDADFYA